MQLSEEDHDAIYKAAGKIDFPPSHNEIADAAFSLGIERARVVAPLVWEPSESGGWKALNYRVISTDSGGWGAYKTDEPHFGRYAHNSRDLKAACQKHHVEFVLSQLEDV